MSSGIEFPIDLGNSTNGWKTESKESLKDWSSIEGITLPRQSAEIYRHGFVLT